MNNLSGRSEESSKIQQMTYENNISNNTEQKVESSRGNEFNSISA